MKQNYLFVYGTLMSCFENDMARELRRGAFLMGKARVKGTLYDLNGYPGLVLGAGNDDYVIHGELYRIGNKNVNHMIQKLDLHEGEEFVRTEGIIFLGAEVINAYVYGLKGLPDKEKLISSGDYEEHLLGTKLTDNKYQYKF